MDQNKISLHIDKAKINNILGFPKNDQIEIYILGNKKTHRTNLKHSLLLKLLKNKPKKMQRFFLSGSN